MRQILIGGASALASLVLGIIFGLIFSWGVFPLQYTNADLVDLRQSHKDDLVRMISAAYELDGDLNTAKKQLLYLGIGNSVQTINTLIDQETRSGNSTSISTLIRLRRAIASSSVATPTVVPTQVMTPTVIYVIATPEIPVATLTLVEKTPLSCIDEPETAKLRFTVRDTAGLGVPNVGIEIRWDAGSETIYTGLKPERGVGYADFEATPGNFSVTVLNAKSETVSNLVIGAPPANCKNDNGKTPRGWKLVFQQN